MLITKCVDAGFDGAGSGGVPYRATSSLAVVERLAEPGILRRLTRQPGGPITRLGLDIGVLLTMSGSGELMVGGRR